MRRREKEGYLRSNVKLINESNFFRELFASVSGEVLLHLLHNRVGFQVRRIRHGFVTQQSHETYQFEFGLSSGVLVGGVGPAQSDFSFPVTSVFIVLSLFRYVTVLCIERIRQKSVEQFWTLLWEKDKNGFRIRPI